MEINSNTIYKSILGSIVHYTKAIQVEQKVTLDDAKIIANDNINKGLVEVLNVKDNKDTFLEYLNNLSRTEKRQEVLITILRIKDLYEKNT